MPLKIPPFTPVPIQPTSAEPFSTFVNNTPLARTPLSGTELVPLIQGGVSSHVPPGLLGLPRALIAIVPASGNLAFVVNGGTGSDSNSGAPCFDGTIVGGTGYTGIAFYGTYASPIALTGGSGTGATAVIRANGLNAIDLVVGISPGAGYKVGDVLSAASGSIGGGAGFTFTLTAIRAAAPFATVQHAATVSQGFDYQGIYNCAIILANATYREFVVIGDALTYGVRTGSNDATLFIRGDTATPTNTVIKSPVGGSPNNGSLFTVTNSFVNLDGVSLSVTDSGGNMLLAANTSVVAIGDTAIDFNTGTGASWFGLISAQVGAKVRQAGGGLITIQGGGAGGANFFVSAQYANIELNSTVTFNSAINLLGSALIVVNEFSTFLTPSWTTPGNITGGTVASVTDFSQLIVGSDPTTITWPSGPFTNSTIDGSCNIDGFFYAHQKSGLPANTDLYKGAWGFFKDTSGGGVYAAYNDAGTIKKVALT